MESKKQKEKKKEIQGNDNKLIEIIIVSPPFQSFLFFLSPSLLTPLRLKRKK